MNAEQQLRAVQYIDEVCDQQEVELHGSLAPSLCLILSFWPKRSESNAR
jgi:hypothetical protein